MKNNEEMYYFSRLEGEGQRTVATEIMEHARF